MAKGKDASRVKAMQLFPLAAKDLSLKKHHGRADALMMAYYAAITGVPEAPKPKGELTLFG